VGALDAGGCSTLEGKLARWAKIDETPFYPWHYAGLDLGSSEAGITLAQAEAINCIGDPADAAAYFFAPATFALFNDGGSCDSCGHCYGAVTWGTSQEVGFVYDTTNTIVAGLFLDTGYTGGLSFEGTVGSAKHSYEVRIGSAILKDGAPFEIDWTDPHYAALMEIYNGILETFVMGFPVPPQPGYVCTADQSCFLIAGYEGHTYFGVYGTTLAPTRLARLPVHGGGKCRDPGPRIWRWRGAQPIRHGRREGRHRRRRELRPDVRRRRALDRWRSPTRRARRAPNRCRSGRRSHLDRSGAVGQPGRRKVIQMAKSPEITAGNADCLTAPLPHCVPSEF
jgi:hypothetical protein